MEEEEGDDRVTGGWWEWKVGVFWPLAALPHQSQSVETSEDESSGKICCLDLWERKHANRTGICVCVCVCVCVCDEEAIYSVACTYTARVCFYICSSSFCMCNVTSSPSVTFGP